MKIIPTLCALLFTIFSVQIAQAECSVTRMDTVGVVSCPSGSDLTIQVECPKTSKSISGVTSRILSEQSATFSIGSASWTTNLILGKRIRLAAFNKRKNEQDFYGLGYDYITVVNAMKKGIEMRMAVGSTEYLIPLAGFTKSYNQACK